MPIIKPSTHTAPVFYPDTDYPIVKYIDLTKFISLLFRKSFFFCRVDKLEDQFEGTTSKVNFDFRVRMYERLSNQFSQAALTTEEITKKVEQQYEFERKQKALNCVNCWNKKNNESAALWKIYSDFSKGIMIKSSIGKLIKAFENTKEEISLSEIRYLDYNNDIMPDGNSAFPFLHKQIAYSFEDEVRLIYNVKTDEGWEYDWTKEEVQEGFYITVDLDTLIDEIVVGPYSPKWYFKIIEDISTKYGLNKPITKSVLSID
jgi:hypothetical protein